MIYTLTSQISVTWLLFLGVYAFKMSTNIDGAYAQFRAVGFDF